LHFREPVQSTPERAGGGGGRFAVARYNPDGSLDTSFGGDGTVYHEFLRFGAFEDLKLPLPPREKIVGNPIDAWEIGSSGQMFGVAQGGLLRAETTRVSTAPEAKKD
jgi:hypothetical protein